MSDLAQQRAFADWLVEREPSADFGRDDGLDPMRLRVHRNTFVASLVEALAESFPVTRALAGAGFFDAMARERVLADPPRSPVLTEYALDFPAFVLGFEPAQATPVLAAMAQLEALRLRAFHAFDEPALGLERFHALACDAARLACTSVRLHPAAGWLPARQPLLELWRLHDEADDATVVDLGAIDPERRQDLLVHRPEFVVRMRALPAGAVAFLDALAGGCSLAIAFAEAGAADPATEPAALFSLLLQEGLVAELLETPKELQ